MTTPEEIKAEYASSLADLKFNSKPLINVLTMLAEENSPNSEVIVEAIETHLSKVSTEVKLPILYLIDCIVKNVGGTYTALFSQNIVSTFCGVFKAVDEKTRAEMFRLRQTWNEVFPQMKLYAIDVQISLLDPAWPVTAKPPSNSIHFNPKFLKPTATANSKVDPSPTPIIPAATGTIDKETLVMQEKLIQKQRELLELQQKKLELEVLQTKVKLQEQIKNNVPIPMSGRPQNILLKPEVAKQLVPNLKQKPAGISATSAAQLKSQGATSNGSRIHPVNSALVAAASKPIRDPRLLRQQQKPIDSNSDVQLGQKTTLIENIKIVTNKAGVRKVRNDPRLVVNKDNIPTPKNDTNKPNLSNSRNFDNTVQQKSQSLKGPRSSPKLDADTNSLKSSSSSSLDSPSKSKSDKLRSPRHKKKDKSEQKSVSPKELIPVGSRSDKSESPSSAFKGAKGLTKNRNYVRRNLEDPSPEPPQDEDLRSLGPPEKQPRLQSSPTEEQTLSTHLEQSSTVSSTKATDVDLRQMSTAVTRKRSTDATEQTTSKKTKSEVLDRLFGDEDTDLRQLANAGKPPDQPVCSSEPTPVDSNRSPIVDSNRSSIVDSNRSPIVDSNRSSIVDSNKSPIVDSNRSPIADTNRSPIVDLSRSPSVDSNRLPIVDLSRSPVDLKKSAVNSDRSPVDIERPPTPPPPIISSSGSPSRNDASKRNLDAIRAKLANATSRDKVMSKSFFKKNLSPQEDQDLRVPKVSSSTDISHKIIISPEDEDSIRSGNMSKEQEAQLLKKIIMQMEIKKLKEAKKKDHAESFNVSLQPISDDEFVDSDEDKNIGSQEKSGPTPEHFPPPSESSVMPFKDIDERINSKHMQPKPDFIPQPFYPRDGRDVRRFPGPHNWRGRGRRTWENPPMGPNRPSVRGWGPAGNWRNMPPNFPHPRDFPPMPMPIKAEEDLTRSPDISGDAQLTNGAVNQEEIRTINIDGVPKDIRYYDETAVVFMNWDEPREISFLEDGRRRVIFNDSDSCLLSFNEPYKDVIINNNLHKVRLGAPSREIYIDYVPYECYFGSAGIRINLNSASVTVKLEGPPPQVKIGEVKRTDLVAGKINLFINAKIVVPVFLDAKLQKFVIEGEMSTLKFVNALETVLINDKTFEVEYGGLPKPIIINDKKHFIRFSVLPKGIRPGRIKIKDMERLAGAISPPPMEENSQDSAPYNETFEPALPAIGRVKRPNVNSPDRNSNSPNSYQNLLEQQSLNNLDLLSNAMTPSSGTTPTTGGYKVENTPTEEPKEAPDFTKPVLPVPPPNIYDLFQKLVASGFVTTGNKPSQPSVLPKKEDEPEKPKPEVVSDISDNANAASKVKRNVCTNLKLIIFEKPESLKVRQPVLYTFLYSGMQCSSCGMRFSPEASMQYSQHLDWHFRQNRRGKRNIRVASSRKWYYSLSDWKNYEELEDLEEREKNYFDQQQQSEGADSEADEDVEVPSVPADPDSTDECCEVCREKFDQFFNEEKEQWHLRNAIRVEEEKTYHPVCYEDYQKSLLEQADESKTEETNGEEKTQDLFIPGLEIVIDDDDDDEPLNPDDEPYEPGDIVLLGSDESKSAVDPDDEKAMEEELDDGDDDDVILNEVAPIKIVVDDDDEDPHDSQPNAGSDEVKVKDEKIDDGFVEVSGLVSLQNRGQIKIKAEPVVPGYELPTEPIGSPGGQSSGDVEEVPLEEPEADSFKAHQDLISSIDGNIELTSTAPSIVTTSVVSTNKIKINISKPLPVIANKEKESSVPESSFPSDTYIDPSEPFPPGEEPVPVNLKPALRGVNLKKLPIVKRGTELTGLCSIM